MLMWTHNRSCKSLLLCLGVACYVVALVLTARTAAAGTVTAVAGSNDAIDAFIASEQFADSNFGQGVVPFGFSPLAVGQQNAFTGNQIGRQLYSFDVPGAYTHFGPVISATLALKVFDNFAGSPYPTAVYGLSDAWNEATVTWNTQPPVDSLEIDSVLASCCGNVYQYDVTSYIQNQVNAGDSLFSFQQRGKDETVVGGLRWFEREGNGQVINGIAEAAPELRIVQFVAGNEDTIVRVSEPATIFLLGAGIVGFFVLGRAL